MARRLIPPLLALLLVLCLPAAGAEPGSPLETSLARAARERRWEDVLALLVRLQHEKPERYAEGRFDYLTARALASTGRTDEALPRFERYIATGDLFDVPARLSAARIRFLRGEGSAALDHLFPLLQRKDSPVARRAIRIALDALETRFDSLALARLVAARPDTGARERRRIVGNTATTMTVDKPFVATPDATSTYDIYAASDKLWIRFGGRLGGGHPRVFARIYFAARIARQRRTLRGLAHQTSRDVE